jgi:hypothetical protein
MGQRCYSGGLFHRQYLPQLKCRHAIGSERCGIDRQRGDCPCEGGLGAVSCTSVRSGTYLVQPPAVSKRHPNSVSRIASAAVSLSHITPDETRCNIISARAVPNLREKVAVRWRLASAEPRQDAPIQPPRVALSTSGRAAPGALWRTLRRSVQHAENASLYERREAGEHPQLTPPKATAGRKRRHPHTRGWLAAYGAAASRHTPCIGMCTQDSATCYACRMFCCWAYSRQVDLPLMSGRVLHDLGSSSKIVVQVIHMGIS